MTNKTPTDAGIAYAIVDRDSGWGVGACREGEQGYHPVNDYGPYEDESQAQGIVDRLNKRLGLTPKRAAQIVASTMRGINRLRRSRSAR